MQVMMISHSFEISIARAVEETEDIAKSLFYQLLYIEVIRSDMFSFLTSLMN